MSEPAARVRRGGVWTAANVVTCVRIVLIPVFMILSIQGFEGESAPLAVAAFALYVALSLTDKVDGYLARSRGEVTDFGKFLDPIADKLLVFSALLIFLVYGQVNVWVVFVILVREFLVSALRMLAGSKGVVIAADSLGKAKTATTMVGLCCLLAAVAASMTGHVLGWWLWLAGQLLVVVATLLTVVSGAQYFWNARDVVFGEE